MRDIIELFEKHHCFNVKIEYPQGKVECFLCLKTWKPYKDTCLYEDHSFYLLDDLSLILKRTHNPFELLKLLAWTRLTLDLGD